MDLIYLAIIGPVGPMAGVIKKIYDQVELLNNTGLKTHAYLFTKEEYHKELSGYLNSFQVHSAFSVVKVNETGALLRKLPIIRKIFRGKEYFDKMQHIISQHEFSTIIYLRYPYSTPEMLKFIKKQRQRVVLEHQTKELDELKESRNWYLYISEMIFKPLVYRYIKGSVCVTEEIAQHQKKKVLACDARIMVITNHFNVKSVQVRTAPAYDNKTLKLLFVGNYNYWHGLDRVLTGISEYRGQTKISLYVVGEGAGIESLKEKAISLRVIENVLFCGPRFSGELDAYYNLCHIGIGPMAIHRKNLQQASSLKIREYLARGIPFIMSGFDEDVTGSKTIEPYYMQCPADDTLVDMNRVIHFAGKVLNIKKHPEIIREFAEREIDSSIKAKELKMFIESIRL